MRQLPRISVVVVSHDRPGWLARCISSLKQLDYPSFEVVVAADTAALERLDRHPARGYLKTVEMNEPNISLARNTALEMTGGDLVAFVDDDSVAEPLWLRHHAHAFQAFDIAASVGFVRGRNGISYQTAVTSVDAEGETHREAPGDGHAFVPKLSTGRALKLVGTNSVFRREILYSIGGFDPAFRFFHDDTDISLRIAQAGYAAAVVPLAQVHHAFAPSSRRTRLRAPTDLTEIGRSTAIFAHRYRGAPPDELKERLFARERARLIQHMVRGTCEPRDVDQRMSTLADGWREGAVIAPPLPEPRASRDVRFEPMPYQGDRHVVITTRYLGRRKALREARHLVDSGVKVSVFSFSLTVLRHHMRYVQPGVWLQTGGQFGRSVRTAQRYRWCRFADRVKEEIRRVAMVRGIGESAASHGIAAERCPRNSRWRAGPGAEEKDVTKGQS